MKGRSAKKRKTGREPISDPHKAEEDWETRAMSEPNLIQDPMQDRRLKIGPCLTIGAYLGSSPLKAILDTGAGVSIAGRRFEELYRKVYGRPPKTEPIAVSIKGINSAASLKATGIVSFPLKFGPRATPHVYGQRGTGARMGRRDTTRMEPPHGARDYLHP